MTASSSEKSSPSAPEGSSQFIREDGAPVRSLSMEDLQVAISSLLSEYESTEESIVECAAYSLAMVARYALGLSSGGGKVCGLISPGIPGNVVLACLKHLVNGGAEAVALFIDTPNLPQSSVNQRYERCVRSYGVQTLHVDSNTDLQLLRGVIAECHNILWGVLSIAENSPLTQRPVTQRAEDQPFVQSLIRLLNDMSTPIHTVLAPSGFDLSTGARSGELLYASSTLSLGAPLLPLLKYSAAIGRHYLTDIGLPLSFYQELQKDSPAHFHEQPVIKLALQEQAPAA